jgi:hypothetical protein
MPNSYQYSTSNGTAKGAFNIYQARNGAIYILMGKTVTPLTIRQLDDLALDLYALIDFDVDAYKKHYNL